MADLCDKCEKQKNCSSYRRWHEVYKREVGACSDYTKINTNADRIRSMSDEKLADYLSGLVALDCYACPLKPCDYEKECEEVWLEWLKKETDGLHQTD